MALGLGQEDNSPENTEPIVVIATPQQLLYTYGDMFEEHAYGANKSPELDSQMEHPSENLRGEPRFFVTPRNIGSISSEDVDVSELDSHDTELWNTINRALISLTIKDYNPGVPEETTVANYKGKNLTVRYFRPTVENSRYLIQTLEKHSALLQK